MLQTPLHGFHRQTGATLVDFAGWEMPVTYEGLIAEHNHTRQHASIFDVSHMGRIEFSGKDAEGLMEWLNTRPIASMQPGQSRYSHMCREDGGILDDVIVSRMDNRFMVVCNASNRAKLMPWWQQHAEGKDVKITDRTDKTAMIAVQGPAAFDTMNELLPIDLDGLKRYHFRGGNMFGHEYLVARSGYTGEDGVEIIFPASLAETAVNMLVSRTAGSEHPVKPAGLGARDTLRTEAGMPLYGHELSEDWDPITGGQAWVVGKDKDFVGREAIEAVRANPQRCLVGFEVDGKRTPRQGAGVAVNGEEVGVITSGVKSPTLEKIIAMGFVPPQHSEVGTQVQITLKAATLEAKVVPIPFYKASK